MISKRQLRIAAQKEFKKPVTAFDQCDLTGMMHRRKAYLSGVYDANNGTVDSELFIQSLTINTGLDDLKKSTTK